MTYPPRRGVREARELWKEDVWLADEETLKKHVSSAPLLEWPMPTWRHHRYEGFALETERGLIRVRKFIQMPLLGWAIYGEGWLLATATPSRRVVVFERSFDAKLAARLHEKDGFESWSLIPDNLCWAAT
jgi:hypothetical protein